jgi:three-Cys-motif partner protein
MSDKHHTWHIGDDPPIIRPHSLAKHRVLQAYLEQYVAVLTANPRQESLRLTLVDGFAGGGRYRDSRTGEERPGSPLVMLGAMAAAEQRARELRSKPFNLDVDYFFIENETEALEYLKSVIRDSPFRSLLREKIHFAHESFLTTVPHIIDFIKKRGRAGRTIFLLDQCGYGEVPLGTIKAILGTLRKAEVILTFAVDSLIDYLSTNEQTQEILKIIHPSSFDHMMRIVTIGSSTYRATFEHGM